MARGYMINRQRQLSLRREQWQSLDMLELRRRNARRCYRRFDIRERAITSEQSQMSSRSFQRFCKKTAILMRLGRRQVRHFLQAPTFPDWWQPHP
jgi:hypothetical protein